MRELPPATRIAILRDLPIPIRTQYVRFSKRQERQYLAGLWILDTRFTDLRKRLIADPEGRDDEIVDIKFPTSKKLNPLVRTTLRWTFSVMQRQLVDTHNARVREATARGSRLQ